MVRNARFAWDADAEPDVPELRDDLQMFDDFLFDEPQRRRRRVRKVRDRQPPTDEKSEANESAEEPRHLAGANWMSSAPANSERG